MKIRLREYDARRIDVGEAPSTRWRTETWVIYEKGHPGSSVAQVQIFKDRDGWNLWTGNITLASTRELGRELVRKRAKIASRTLS